MSTHLNLFEKLSSAELGLIKAVLETDVEIKLVIPETVTPDQIYDQLIVLCEAVENIDAARSRLMSVVGRLMILCSENPDIYLGRGYTSWKDFMDRCIYARFGWARSNAYRAMQTLRQWPNLPLSDYAEIGSKFAILNKFSSQNGTNSRKLLDIAKAKTYRDLEAWAIETGRIERGEDRGATISVGCNAALRKRWEDMVRNPAVIEAAGSDSQAAILECMMNEFLGTYGIGT